MIQIIDNATFRAWVINYAKEQKKTRYEICAKVAKTIKKSSETVYGWQAKNSKQPITAGNAALITAAIERGEI